jgi:hypothetical protein
MRSAATLWPTDLSGRIFANDAGQVFVFDSIQGNREHCVTCISGSDFRRLVKLDLSPEQVCYMLSRCQAKSSSLGRDLTSRTPSVE